MLSACFEHVFDVSVTIKTFAGGADVYTCTLVQWHERRKICPSCARAAGTADGQPSVCISNGLFVVLDLLVGRAKRARGIRAETKVTFPSGESSELLFALY